MDQVGERPRTHFSHDPCSVNFDRALLRPEFTGDLLVESALDNADEHFVLTRGQSRHPLSDLFNSIASRPRLIVKNERGLYRLE